MTKMNHFNLVTGHNHMFNLTYSTLSNRRNGCNKQNGVQKLNQIKFVMDPISRMALEIVNFKR